MIFSFIVATFSKGRLNMVSYINNKIYNPIFLVFKRIYSWQEIEPWSPKCRFGALTTMLQIHSFLKDFYTLLEFFDVFILNSRRVIKSFKNEYLGSLVIKFPVEFIVWKD